MTLLNLLITLVLATAAGIATDYVVPGPNSLAFALVAAAAVIGVSGLLNFARGSGSRRINSGSGRRINTSGTMRVLDKSGSMTSPAPVRQPARVVSGNFDVTTDTVEGVQKVTVTIKGFSGSDWKTRVRPALDRVSSVKWEFPKNLKDGRRSMTGTVRGGNADAAVSEIRSATARFSA
jgi:hypothetical protein